MSNGYGERVCPVCGAIATELHHMVFRKQVKALENCKLNHIYLCAECHRGTNGVHGKNGHELDRKFKLQFQNKLEFLFNEQYLSRKDIKETLGIKDNAVDSLCKLMKQEKGMFAREDIIRVCMGGKIILEDENNGL